MRNLLIVLGGGLVAVILAAAVWVFMAKPETRLSPAMLNVAGADIGGPFELVAHTGERVRSDALIDRPTLMYFGYTFCPDVCPIDAQIMTEAVDILAERGIDVQPVFVTVDPARDTAEELAIYAEAMHPEMIALTGSDAEIRAAADAYKVFYQRVDQPDSAAEYLMNHTSYTYLVMPDGEVASVFRRGFPPEHLADDVEAVLAAR